MWETEPAGKTPKVEAAVGRKEVKDMMKGNGKVSMCSACWRFVKEKSSIPITQKVLGLNFTRLIILQSDMMISCESLHLSLGVIYNGQIQIRILML